MREDLEQQEQLDAIRGFWDDNKRWIIPLAFVVLASAAAYNGWRWWQSRQADQATEALQAMETALAGQDVDKARAAYKVLSSDFGATAQAALGGLQMARALASAGELAEARTALEQVVREGGPEFAWMARVRLAGVMLDEGNAKGALAALGDEKPPRQFSPLVLDRRGDIQAVLGSTEEARASWKAAADEFPAQSTSREIVLRKLQTLDSFK
jgi:predicted negative regulator of RcsB-dependent stress response